MRQAASAIEDAAGAARGADGSGALTLLAAALPGTVTAQVAPDLVDAWVEDVREWAEEVETLGATIERLREEAGVTDAGVAGMLRIQGPR